MISTRIPPRRTARSGHVIMRELSLWHNRHERSGPADPQPLHGNARRRKSRPLLPQRCHHRRTKGWKPGTYRRSGIPANHAQMPFCAVAQRNPCRIDPFQIGRFPPRSRTEKASPGNRFRTCPRQKPFERTLRSPHRPPSVFLFLHPPPHDPLRLPIPMRLHPLHRQPPPQRTP